MSYRQRVVRLLQVLVALACLAVFVTPTSATADPTSTDLVTGWEALPDSASLSSPAAATGVLRDASGAGIGGAPVVLFAEPSNEILDELGDGDDYDLTPLSRATTAADGSWALRVPDGLDLTGDAQPDDTGLWSVNVLAEGFDANGSSAQGFTLHVEAPPPDPLPSPKGTGSARGAHVRAADAVDVPADETEVATTNWNGTQEPVSVPDNGALTLVDSDMTVTPEVSPPGGLKSCNPPYCTGCSIEKMSSADVTTHVGSLYAAVSGASQTFSYTRGASSTLGEGISLSGDFGSWKQSGTSSISSSVTETFPTLSGQGYKYYYTRFRYGKYRMNCWKFTPTGTGGYTKTRYDLGYWWQATGYEGGATSSDTSGITAGNCVEQEKGSKYSIDKTHAYEWVGGADSSGLLGFWLSSRTGFSSNTSIHISFSAGRHLCGKYGYPGGSPQLLLVNS